MFVSSLSRFTVPIVLLAVLLLSACFHDDDDTAPALIDDVVGDTVDTALVVEPGVTQNARINTIDDIDVFSFTLNAPASLIVQTTGDLDTIGELFFVDPVFGENLVDFSDDIDVGGGNFNFLVFGNSLPAATYFVRVVPFPGTEPGPYTLLSSLISSVDLVGDTIATALPVVSGVAQDGVINNRNDIDMFEVTCVAVCNISATTVGNTDTIGRLLDDTGAQLDTNDDISFPENSNFLVSGNSLNAGLYYVEVQGFDTVIGPYTLTVTVN